MPKKTVDYETIDISDDAAYTSSYSDDSDGGHDFPSMFMKLLSRINIKIAIFIFMLGLFIFSDLFVRNVLQVFNGAVNNMSCPTSHGTIVQLTFLVIGYLLIDLLVQGKYI